MTAEKKCAFKFKILSIIDTFTLFCFCVTQLNKKKT